MPKELAKQYAPQGTEDRIYQNWCDKGYFHTQIDRSKKPFTIVMPPPNVTGQLHMGHAMDETWQDILTDHASIATEAKVVAKMREEGLTKEMVGRDGFLERAWDWKNTYGNRIVSQLKKLGCSCDWQRERFTMDEGCSNAVKEVFVRLYDKGLIYRGNRMVNWLPPAPKPCWAIPPWPSTPMTPVTPTCTAAMSSCRCWTVRSPSSATSMPTWKKAPAS